MPAVADYIIVRDPSVTIPQSGSKPFWERKELNFGSGTRFDQRMILQFFYVSSSDADKLEFRFRIRGKNEDTWTNIRTIRVTGNSFGTVHEIFNGSAAFPSPSTIQALKVGGSGSVKLSDIIIWIQRDA